MSTDIREHVREKYAEAARAAADADDCGCGCGCGDASRRPPSSSAGPLRHRGSRGIPEAAARASLGCGNPVAVAELHPGETVLDLGSGGGIDVLLSARRVGPTGTVYGLDMTDEMLALAQQNAQAAAPRTSTSSRATEAIPLPAESVDVVISNCVVNLSPDKPTVSESARPSARRTAGISTSSPRTAHADRAERGSFAGCRGGPLRERVPRGPSRQACRRRSSRTHEVAEGCTADRPRAQTTCGAGRKRGGHLARARGSRRAPRGSVDVLLDVVEVERDPEVRVARRGDDALAPRAATSAFGSVETTQTSGPCSPSPRGVATVAPSSSSPAKRRSTSDATCASIAGTPTSAISCIPATPG